MVFTVASNAQTPCFDRGKAQPDGLAQSRRIDVGDPILITHPAI